MKEIINEKSILNDIMFSKNIDSNKNKVIEKSLLSETIKCDLSTYNSNSKINLVNKPYVKKKKGIVEKNVNHGYITKNIKKPDSKDDSLLNNTSDMLNVPKEIDKKEDIFHNLQKELKKEVGKSKLDNNLQKQEKEKKIKEI